jgi:Spherulation-specific family 4/Secretion system C-terminal sorting domain
MCKMILCRVFMIAILLFAQAAGMYALTGNRNNAIANNTKVEDSLNMKVLVPAYFDPSVTNYWGRLATQAAKMPGRLYAIVNKANGPGPSYDPSYALAINNLHTNSGKVIGYVWTNYGGVSLNIVKSDIDAWYSFYPSIDGIFLDGQANATGKEAYYIEVYNYIKQKSSSALVVSNPGTNTLESYLVYNGKRVSDVICIFESNVGFDTWTPSSWCNKYSKDNFCVLPYNTSSGQYVSRAKRAASLNIGWIYLTSDAGANPWDTLPPYFEEFCDYLNITGIKNEIRYDKLNFNLNQNYPNPFNPSTTISYQITDRSFISLKIYDFLGGEIETLINQEQLAGKYAIAFNSSAMGIELPSGVYFYRLQAGDYVETKKMILLK